MTEPAATSTPAFFAESYVALAEALNYQLRKVTKARGSFPSDAAALKLLYLAIRNINQKRGSTPGSGTYRWTEALNRLRDPIPRPTPTLKTYQYQRLQLLTQKT